MICLDTSVIIDLFSGEEAIERKLSEIDGVFAVSYPTVCELFKGVYLSSDPEKGENKVEKFLANVQLLESGPRSAKLFGKLHEKYPEKSDFDLMIASICISEGTRLLTRDKDFRGIEELDKEIV